MGADQRGPAGSGPGKEAGCEEKEARGGSGWSSSDGPHGLGSAYPYAGADVRACSCPRALDPDGDGTIRDQLSLAVAIAGPLRWGSKSVQHPNIRKVCCEPALRRMPWSCR